MSSSPRFFTLYNPTGMHAGRVLLRLLRNAVKPSTRVFTWRSSYEPIGSPQRPSQTFFDLHLYSDQSGFEFRAGSSGRCFGVEPPPPLTKGHTAHV